MEVLRFGLGIRFDFFTDEVTEEQKTTALFELCSALPVSVTEGLLLFAGVHPLSEPDSRGVYTVVFTKGSLKKMRALYRTVESDAMLHCMLCPVTPYLQNNVIREFDDLEYLGEVGADGRVTGGARSDLCFVKKPLPRRKFDPSGCIVVAPNSFKGTFSANTAARHICRALRSAMPYRDIVPLPVADGGDGTLAAVEAMLRGRRCTATVTGPYGGEVEAAYYAVDGRIAVIESALASGLALCDENALDPLKATSRGTGELVLRALHEGLTQIYLGLGGSATNDCGIGAANALGFKFLDAEGSEVTDAAHMSEIVRIDASERDMLFFNADIPIVLMCDVDNPLTGMNGATYTFGPQKGADEKTLEILEKGMQNMARVLKEFNGSFSPDAPGAGAAGGMGAMFMTLGYADQMSGAEAILDIAKFDKLMKRAAFVVTGEGCLDATSVRGKAVGTIAQRAAKAGVRIAILSGKRGKGADAAEKLADITTYCEDGIDRTIALDAAAKVLAERIRQCI